MLCILPPSSSAKIYFIGQLSVYQIKKGLRLYVSWINLNGFCFARVVGVAVQNNIWRLQNFQNPVELTMYSAILRRI